MNKQSAASHTSTFKEWTNFLAELNNKKNSDAPLLKRSASPDLIVMHLEKQFSRTQHEQVFYRPARQKQLSLNF